MSTKQTKTDTTINWTSKFDGSIAKLRKGTIMVLAAVMTLVLERFFKFVPEQGLIAKDSKSREKTGVFFHILRLARVYASKGNVDQMLATIPAAIAGQVRTAWQGVLSYFEKYELLPGTSLPWAVFINCLRVATGKATPEQVAAFSFPNLIADLDLANGQIRTATEDEHNYDFTKLAAYFAHSLPGSDNLAMAAFVAVPAVNERTLPIIGAHYNEKPTVALQGLREVGVPQTTIDEILTARLLAA